MELIEWSMMNCNENCIELQILVNNGTGKTNEDATTGIKGTWSYVWIRCIWFLDYVSNVWIVSVF